MSVFFYFLFEQLFLLLFCLLLVHVFLLSVGNIVGVERDTDGSSTASRATESG